MTDDLQSNYMYELTEPEGKCFTDGFKPELSPKQMLEFGVFGGHYFAGYHEEYPPAWFKDAKISDTNDSELNYFAVPASQTREEWRAKGWIHEQDPRGWFQWYCRYFLGRRSSDDERQIKRWKQMSRHVGQIRANCRQGDELCRRRQRQALLHWAYDSRKI